MMYRFYVLVTADVNSYNYNNVISIYSPDLELELLNRSGLFLGNHAEFAAEEIKKNLDQLTINHKPKNLSQLQQPIVNEYQRWVCCEVDIDHRNKYCTRILPITAHTANIVAIASGCFSTYMSFSIASRENHQQTSNFGISATILNIIVNLIMYTYSDTSDTMMQMGNNLDRFFARCSGSHYLKNDNSRQTVPHNPAKNLAYGTMMLLLSAHMLISAMETYQSTILLAKRFLDLKQDQSPEERATNMDIILWLGIYLMIVSSFYSTFAFAWTFAVKFVDDLMDKAQKLCVPQPGVLFGYAAAVAKKKDSIEQTDGDVQLSLLPRRTLSV